MDERLDLDKIKFIIKDPQSWDGYELKIIRSIIDDLIEEVARLRGREDELNKAWSGAVEACNKLSREQIESLQSQLEAMKAERVLLRQAAGLNLKSCNCQNPNWMNVGGTLLQCSHCGGWEE